MKAYGRIEGYLHSFKTSALGGSEQSASQPSPFMCRVRALCTHYTGRWVNLESQVGCFVEEKMFCPCQFPTHNSVITLTMQPSIFPETREKFYFKQNKRTVNLIS
jgi:hypothetical protein